MPLLTEEQLGVAMDFESVAKAGSLLGSCGIIVMDEDTCMVRALQVVARFYHDESCGQCSPCREGTGWLHRVVSRLEEGGADPRDVELLLQISDNMMGNTICLLADAAAMPVKSFVTKFRGEFEEHLAAGGCPARIIKQREAENALSA